jgi:hypothetical protein
MDASLTQDLVRALPPSEVAALLPAADLTELGDELHGIAEEVLEARMLGLGLPDALEAGSFPAMSALHRDLRDSMLDELPREVVDWAQSLAQPGHAAAPGLGRLHRQWFDQARAGEAHESDDHDDQLRFALAEFLLFESVRLRLLASAWSNEDFEALGGDEQEIDHIAWTEVLVMLAQPALADPSVRPLALMVAAGSVTMARESNLRAEALRLSGEEQREQLRMRARLRAALRELRLPESILLENALANILGEERQELPDLQDQHPLALAGLSRQAMDQRVSRGRRALSRGPEKWPRRRKQSLFDIFRNQTAGALAPSH